MSHFKNPIVIKKTYVNKQNQITARIIDKNWMEFENFNDKGWTKPLALERGNHRKYPNTL